MGGGEEKGEGKGREGKGREGGGRGEVYTGCSDEAGIKFKEIEGTKKKPQYEIKTFLEKLIS